MNKRDKNKVDAMKYDLVIILCIVILLLLFMVSSLTIKVLVQRDTINELSSKNAKYETILGYVDIHDCACGGHAELVLDEPFGEYYIQCENCRLHTAYYDDRQELIDYWETLFE